MVRCPAALPSLARGLPYGWVADLRRSWLGARTCVTVQRQVASPRLLDISPGRAVSLMMTSPSTPNAMLYRETKYTWPNTFTRTRAKLLCRHTVLHCPTVQWMTVTLWDRFESSMGWNYTELANYCVNISPIERTRHFFVRRDSTCVFHHWRGNFGPWIRILDCG